jgi:hypothetical protein
VSRKVRALLVVLPIAAVGGAGVWAGLWYRSRTVTPAALVKRIPASDALVVYLDFDALRRGGVLGLLENPKATEEPEYREFARQIDFDYREDLDSVLLAVAPTGKFILARGRFHWKSLRAYAEAQNGRCDNSLCRLEGSTPDRRISFFPVQSNLLALAVSNDDSAALRMSREAGGPDPEVPGAPVWVSIPSAVLQSGDSLPAETRTFARSLGRADTAVLSFVPEANRYAAKLSVRCRSGREAADLASELARTTALLQQSFEREHRVPNPADLTGVLTAGSFRSDGNRVFGYWPIARTFVDSLLGAPK